MLENITSDTVLIVVLAVIIITILIMILVTPNNSNGTYIIGPNTGTVASVRLSGGDFYVNNNQTTLSIEQPTSNVIGQIFTIFNNSSTIVLNINGATGVRVVPAVSNVVVSGTKIPAGKTSNFIWLSKNNNGNGLDIYVAQQLSYT